MFCLEQVADKVNKSAACNIALLLQGSGVVWCRWDDFLSNHFKAVKGVRSYHHLTFDGKKPGIVAVKKAVDAPSTDMQILKTSKEALCEAGLPEVIPPAGLTEERKRYLFKEIRPHVLPAF